MSSAPRARILLVDDRPENLLALEAILEPLDVDTVRADSGPEALRQVLRQEFAVILLDVQMPGMNGFETAELIKARERSRFVPIIFLTAISKEQEYVFRGYSVGAVDYMFKPLEPDVLRSKVSVFVDLYAKQELIRDQADLLRESERRELELQHKARLSESEARVAEILDSAMEAIITFDDERRITIFNGAAERTFGRSAEEAIGDDLDILFDPRFPRDLLDRARELAARSPDERRQSAGAGAARAEILTGCRANGDPFPLETSLSALALGDGHVFTVIGRDISERRRAEEALRAQTEALASTTGELRSLNEELSKRQTDLERAITARSRFYANMSHELRTPINAILGYSALLLDNIYGSLNDQQVNGIERTHRAAKHLLELVNDVLDLSKIEAGKLELQLESVLFPALIEDLFVTVRPLADEHGSTLTLLNEAGETSVLSDARRVRQILINLLSNAIKFGSGNPIEVIVRPCSDGGIEVAVIDEGIGILPDDLDKIFDEFVQLEKPQKQEGTGLGLPISKRLAELLNGSLVVESEVGNGSTFRLCLPRAADLLPPDRSPADDLAAAG